jgi:hypothetical protein
MTKGGADSLFGNPAIPLWIFRNCNQNEGPKREITPSTTRRVP